MSRADRLLRLLQLLRRHRHPVRAYGVDMGGGFVPYRRDIAYAKDAREIPVRAIASELEFITHNAGWGLLARRGHFEIGVADLHRIADAMGVSWSRSLSIR